MKSTAIEQFWNIVHYFACKAESKLEYSLLKFTGIVKLYNSSFMKKHFEKASIKAPMRKLEPYKYGGRLTTLLIYTSPFIFFTGLFFHYIAIFIEKPKNFTPILMAMILFFIISWLFNYVLLFHKDKYLKYFEKFDKKPHKWKIKWAWISMGVILFPFIVLILNFVLYNNK